MASIFKNKQIKENLKKFDIPDMKEKIKIIEKWFAVYQDKTLHQKTESECEQAFNQDFFNKILDYKNFPNEPYTIDPKGKTQTSSQKPDAILGYFTKDIQKVSAVVEIKDVNTPLDKSQKREGNLSPIQQAFKYKPQYQECSFVIATNFFEIRLYKDNQLDYELFTLESLLNPDNIFFEFRKFYYLLCEENFINKINKTKTEELLSEIRLEQEKISKEFYSEYKDLRKKLISDILKNNECENNFAISKAQKIIDRIVFVCFCEDLDLLPEYTLEKFLKSSEDSFSSLWDNLKGLFQAIDKGSEKLEIPNGYNGGLFCEDLELNNLKISDEVIKNFIKIGKYDFAEDLSVNILGHIFEQSISDIEALRKTEEVDKKKSKRKKDGIFYTPEYIVDYIVRNSLGKYLEEKLNEIMINQKFKLKEDIQDKNYQKRLKEIYQEYRVILQNVKVFDPACGSGAFLVKVFDFLLAENKRVGKIIEDNDLFSTDSYYKSILENNIFGVDLNEESVEITKLSLWLKTAEKGKKLTSLNNNIKCGNSLIDDEDVAGDKAFKWNEEFKEIMNNGGFDVVLGNPPYGAKLSKEIQSHLNKKYIQNASETAIAFIKLSKNLLKEKGYLSFIIPKSFSFASNYKSIRECVLNDILEIVDCKKVWKEVKLEQIIFAISKNININFYESKILDNQNFIKIGNIDKKTFQEFGFYLNGISEQELKVGQKIHNAGLFLNDISKNQRGAILQKYISDQGDLNIIGGAEVQRFGVKGTKGKIDKKYINSEQAYIKDNSILVQNLIAHIENPIDHIKITASLPRSKNEIIVDTINQITINSTYSNKFIWILLNSTLINWYAYRFIFGKAIRTMHFDNSITSRIPIPKISQEQQKPFIEKTDLMLELNKELKEKKNKFLKLIQSRFELDKISKKLDKFYELDFDEFKKQLNIKKIKLEEESELMDFFEKNKNELGELKNKIDTEDKIIDEMIFDLYRLSEEEKKIILKG